MNRLASTYRPRVLVAAALVAGLGGGFAAMRTAVCDWLRPDAPRLSDAHVRPQVETPHGDDPDLDGDGIPDRFDGIFESCGTGGCAYEVYLRRPGGEDQYVGRMEGFWPFQIERLRDDEPADVVAVWHLGATESIGTRYRFADGAYRRFSESTCYRAACTAEHIVHP